MGFSNPNVPWRDFERTLSDRPAPDQVFDNPRAARDNPSASRKKNGRDARSPVPNAGGDAPAWSNKRQPYQPPTPIADFVAASASAVPKPAVRSTSTTPYAELHCHSNFSFLHGASHPEELAEEAARLGLNALALTDHNGFYGVVRFAEAARAVGLPTVFGAQLTLDGPRKNPAGIPDPQGDHLVILAAQPDGYAGLARAITQAQMAGEKGAPRTTLQALCELAGVGTTRHGTWRVLTGGPKGAVPHAMVAHGPSAARRELRKLIDGFGRQHVFVELWDHAEPLDSARNDALAELAMQEHVEVVATNNVHYATPGRYRLATALASVRARRSLDEMDGWLPAAGMAHLRAGAEQMRRFARYPGAVERAAEMGVECAFDLKLVAPNLPPFPCPDGISEMAYVHRLTLEGAQRRYGAPPIAGDTASLRARAYKQIEHELALIDQLGFPGYFLVVWDIVEFCRRNDILCQGRGSAANSAVCYALGITCADAVSLGLLFERFLSPDRDGPPDIDIDIESDRREEVIQYVYQRHGREHAAQVANVITYRARSAVRDMAKALGYAVGQQDAWSKQVDAWASIANTVAANDPTAAAAVGAGAVSAAADGYNPIVPTPNDIPASVLDLAAEVEDFPRHLGIHSGGMVMCDRPVIEVCPVEWGRMENRSVLQWDKDDCAASGLVKFDLLGLGMLSALHYSIDLVREHRGYEIDLATLPQDDAVYAMMCRADTVGVFQIESRAQMATLPRLKPRRFYDLVIEIALIRPGPIQGGSVHPYIRRRNGQEPVTYLHPLLENSLGKTLGIPLFQEQLMQMAIDVAGFTNAESDQLRQAMGSKRSRAKMEKLKERLFEGMYARGVTPDVAEQIFMKMAAFANYGFPESHSVSFAYLVYASSWIKLYEPAAFCAALCNAQPMGFYSPHSLVQDARRHGVVVYSPCINASRAAADLQPHAESAGGVAMRMGLKTVRTVGAELAEAIETERTTNGDYHDPEDLRRRVPALNQAHLEALAIAGAFETFNQTRRQSLWAAGAVAQSKPGTLAGIATGMHAPQLPLMTESEQATADLWATGVTPTGHPTVFIRKELDKLGVVTADKLRYVTTGERVLVGGVVTHRQRPATAGGTTFVNLEDETGLINVICSKGCWLRYRDVARGAPALLVRGKLEHVDGVVNILADKLELLPVVASVGSRNFR